MYFHRRILKQSPVQDATNRIKLGHYVVTRPKGDMDDIYIDFECSQQRLSTTSCGPTAEAVARVWEYVNLVSHRHRSHRLRTLGVRCFSPFTWSVSALSLFTETNERTRINSDAWPPPTSLITISKNGIKKPKEPNLQYSHHFRKPSPRPSKKSSTIAQASGTVS